MNNNNKIHKKYKRKNVENRNKRKKNIKEKYMKRNRKIVKILLEGKKVN